MAKSRARKLADIIVGAGVDIDGNLTFDGGSTSADLTFADNDRANFGDASDLQIYHNGSHSFIKDAGTGDLYIGASNNLALMNSAFSENYLLGTTDGAVTLYYDGSSKLATTSTGVTVTGQLTATSDFIAADSGGTARGYLFGTSGGLFLRYNSGSNLQIQEAGSTRVTFATGGAATFVGNVTSPNLIANTATYSPIIYGGSSNLQLKSNTAEMLAQFVNNGAAELYYDNSKKFETTSTGVDITGTANASTYAATGDSDTYFNFPAANQLSLVGGGTEIVRAYQLAGAYGILRVNGSGSATYPNFTFNGDENTGMYRAGTDILAFATGGSERVRIDSSGAVNIGTTQNVFGGADRYGFNLFNTGQVNSSVDGSNAVTAFYLNRENADGEFITFYKDRSEVGNIANDSTSLVVTGASTGLKFGSAAIWPTSGGGVTNSNGAKDLGASTAKFKDAYFTGTVHAQGGVEVLGTSTMIKHDYNNLGSYVQEIRADDRRLTLSTKTNDSNAGIVFELHDVEKARFDNAGRLLIGQNSNTGGANADNLVVGTGSGNNGITILSGTTNGGTLAFADADADEDGFISYNHPSQFMQFGTAAAEQMRITSAGRVGINETSPDALLHITGQSTAGLIVENTGGIASTQPYVSMAATNYSSGYGTFRWEDQRASQSSPSFIWEVHDGSGTVLAYDFRTGATGASGSKLAITQDGNVGIGTSSPAVSLHVDGTNASIGTIGTPKSDWYTTAYNGLQVADGLTLWGRANDSHMSGNYYVKDVSGVAKDSYINTGYAHDLWFDNGSGDLKYRNAPSGSANAQITSWSTRLVIKNNGNVGIGTTSPGAILDIETPGNTADGTFYSTVTINNTGTSTFSGIRFDRSDVAKWRVGLKPNDTFHISNLFTDGTSSNPNDNAFVIRNNSYIGMGVETPLTDLHIKNGTGSATLLIQSGSNTSSASVLFGDSIDTSRGEIEYTSTDDMVFKTNNVSEQMRIRYTGNVGIGTSGATIAAKLDVQMADSGNTDAQLIQQWQHQGQNTLQLNMYGGATDLVQFAAYNGEQNIAIVTEALASLSATTAKGIYIKSGGNVGINQTNPSHKLQVAVDANGAFIKRDVASNAANLSEFNTHRSLLLLNRNSGSYLAFGGNGSRTDIQATDLASSPTAKNISLNPFGGNVGIGTDSPVSKLHVQDGNLTISSPSGSGGRYLILDNTATGGRDYRLISTNDSHGSLGGGDFAILDYDISGNDAAKTRLLINSSGNIGIGTASPSTKLHVHGADATIRISGDNSMAFHQDSAWNSNMYFGAHYDGSNVVYGATGRGAFKISSYHDGDVSPQYIAFYGANSGTSGNTITWNSVGFAQDEDGNVGIGTTSPGRKLTVQGGSGDNLPVRIIGGAGTSHGSLEFQDPNTTADYKVTIGSKADDFYIQAGGGEKVRILANGNVGIGTTSPNSPLTVAGDIEITGGSNRLLLPNFWIGTVPNTSNNNNAAVLLVNLTTLNANNIGFQFSGSIIGNSYTGQAFVNVNIVKHYLNDNVAFDVSENQNLNSTVSRLQLQLCTVTYNSNSYLAIVKNGGGTGTIFLNGYFQGWYPSQVTEVASGTYTVTTTHGNLNY